MLGGLVAVAACGDDDGGVGPDSGVPVDGGMTSDGGAMDGGGDAGDDAGPELVVLVLRFADALDRSPVEGITACALEYPELPCSRQLAGNTVAIDLPPGPVTIEALGREHAPALLPLVVPAEGLTVEQAPLLRADSLEIFLLVAGIDPSEPAVLVGARELPLDPEAVAGSTMMGPEGSTTWYLRDDLGLTPPRMDTSIVGAGAVVGVAPGTRRVAVSGPMAGCVGDENGWTREGDAQVLDLPVRAGFLTMTYLDCGELPGRDARECDTVAQDCGDGEKCRAHFFVDRDGTDNFGTECVVDGALGLGESCERVDGEAGDDDCAAGAYCAYWDLPRSDPQDRACVPFCQSDDDCVADQFCLGLGTELGDGSCVDRCTVFGEECAPGTHCAPRLSVRNGTSEAVLQCQFVGDIPEGDSCTDAEQCAAGLACINTTGVPFCRRLCDEDAPCDAGESCTALEALPEASVCLPE
ncbi:MAG: hypothetical protein AAGH15_01730 [Myxococcota bacterium]